LEVFESVVVLLLMQVRQSNIVMTFKLGFATIKECTLSGCIEVKLFVLHDKFAVQIEQRGGVAWMLCILNLEQIEGSMILPMSTECFGVDFSKKKLFD
jgi:hypothetical protein